MANILKTIIENDKGELRKLEKMADKVLAYEDEMAALSVIEGNHIIADKTDGSTAKRQVWMMIFFYC